MFFFFLSNVKEIRSKNSEAVGSKKSARSRTYSTVHKIH